MSEADKTVRGHIETALKCYESGDYSAMDANVALIGLAVAARVYLVENLADDGDSPTEAWAAEMKFKEHGTSGCWYREGVPFELRFRFGFCQVFADRQRLIPQATRGQVRKLLSALKGGA